MEWQRRAAGGEDRMVEEIVAACSGVAFAGVCALAVWLARLRPLLEGLQKALDDQAGILERHARQHGEHYQRAEALTQALERASTLIEERDRYYQLQSSALEGRIERIEGQQNGRGRSAA